jgi:hypothetical protein
MSAAINRASEKLGSSLNFLLRDSGESPFRRQIGHRAVPTQKLQRDIHRVAEHARRKQVTHPLNLNKNL